MRFVTLGPHGSNHEYVLKRYLRHHQLVAQIDLVLDFHDGASRLIDNAADFMLQVAVHPQTATVLATYRHSIFVIDTFISGSQDMAVVCRRGIDKPRTLGLQPATRDYVDATRFESLVPAISVASVAQGLMEGKFDAGITSASLAEEMPDRFRIDEFIGTVDDAWIVYGRKPVSRGELVSCRTSPAAAVYAEMLDGASHG